MRITAQPSLINFTISSLKGLVPPMDGLAVYRDVQNTNLSLYVTPAGAKTFFVRKRLHGRDRRITIGPFPTVCIAEARRQAAFIASSVALGEDPAIEERRKRAERITLEKQCQVYLEEHCKPKGRGYKARMQQIMLYLPTLAKRRLHDISREDVARLHRKIEKQSGGVTANRVAQLIRAIYNHAIKNGWDGKNPAASFERFKERSRDRFVQPDEMPYLIASFEAEEVPLVKDYFWILLLTGGRRKNALEMRWEQINWQFKYWRIPDTKNGEPHTVPLVDKAIEILAARKERSQSPWVFPQPNDAGKPSSNPQKAWKRVTARATLLKWAAESAVMAKLIDEAKDAVPAEWRYGSVMLQKLVVRMATERGEAVSADMLDLRIHDLRRTIGSYQALTGTSLSVIGKSLGHKSLAATQIYARLNLDPVRDAMAKATAAILEFQT